MIDIIVYLNCKSDIDIQELIQKINVWSADYRVVVVNDGYMDSESSFFRNIESTQIYCVSNERDLSFSKLMNEVIVEYTTVGNDFLFLLGVVDIEKAEIMEMKSLLELSERHGAVFPRSNVGSGLIPYKGEGYTIGEKKECFEKLKKQIERYTRVFTLDSACMLMNGRVFWNCDGFGETVDGIANTIISYGEKIGEYGFALVMANHVFVEEQSLQEIENNNVTRLSYDKLKKVSAYYESTRIDAIDYFGDVLGKTDKVKILFDIDRLPDIYNGTAELELQLLSHFYHLYSEKYEIDILTNKLGGEFHNIFSRYPRVYTLDTLEGNYHLCISIPQLVCAEKNVILNRHCLKIVAWIMDIIMLRCTGIAYEGMYRELELRKTFLLVDGIVTISKSVLDDVMAFYLDDCNLEYIDKKVIHLSISQENMNDETELPFDNYVLMIGNTYRHKGLLEAFSYIRNDREHNYIIIGTGETGYLQENIYAYKSGRLTNGFMEKLYRKCNMLVFPSLYEGFGLPIIKVLNYGKNVLLYETALNHELEETFSEYKSQFYYFKRYSELLGRINEIFVKPANKVITFSRSWYDVVRELEGCIVEILNKPINLERLRTRFRSFNYAMDNFEYYKGLLVEKIKERDNIISKLQTELIKINEKGSQTKNGYTYEQIEEMISMIVRSVGLLPQLESGQVKHVCEELLKMIAIVDTEVLGYRNLNIENSEAMLTKELESENDFAMAIQAIEKWSATIRKFLK